MGSFVQVYDEIAEKARNWRQSTFWPSAQLLSERASYRWVSAPGGELVFPATNLNGYTFRVRSAAYTGTATCAMHVDEQ